MIVTHAMTTNPKLARGLEVVGLEKSYGSGKTAVPVLSDVNLATSPGEISCVVGPSGAGKSTLLKCLGGLLPPTGGNVLFNGVPIDGPPAEVAIVFQDYSRSLMPWLKAIDNVALPLEGKRLPKKERLEKSMEALKVVNLEYAADRYPWQLSGGMQQRVAIARALAYEPEVLLMDEPFASLDAQTRFDLEDLVLDLKERLGLSILFVTHDIDEAVYLGNEISVIGGTPATVAEHVNINLGNHRDQITTKATSEFASIRTQILLLIRQLSGKSQDLRS